MYKKFYFILLIFLGLTIFSELYCLQHAENCQPKGLVIISCSGKSGSTTLEFSFKKLGFETHRRHVLDEEMYSYILNRSKETPVLLIDSIRDIFSRSIATYFHHLSHIFPLSSDEILAKYQNDQVNFLNFLVEGFNERVLQMASGYVFHQWKPRFNYDCLKEGFFNFKKKYQLKKIGNLYFVNLRFDDIHQWQEIIRSLPVPFDLRQFEILPRNLAQKKWYKEIYQDFLKNFRISQADFETVLKNSVAEIDHFYTDQEKQKLINKWKPHL